MIVIIATKILPGEAGGGNNLRMLISRRRTPIDFEHAVTLSACDRAWHCAQVESFGCETNCLKTELSNTLIVIRDQVRQSYF
jgi:hypothetical protein